MPTYHVHHIIPKHAGGTDDPSNLIRLTIEEHAEAHRKLWEQHRRIQDFVAWKALLNGLSSELTGLLTSEAMKAKKNDPKWRAAQSKKAKNMWSKPGMRERLIEKRKEQNRLGKNPMQGKKHNLVCCISCNKEFGVNGFVHHLKKCK